MQEVKNKKKEENNLANKDSVSGAGGNEMPKMGQDNDENEESPNVDNQKNPKLSVAALMFLFPLVMVADLFDSFSVTGIGVPIVWVISGTATGIVVLWLICVGMRADWVLAINLIDLIPILSILPIKTACLVFVVLNERSNKFQKLVGVAKNLKKKK